MASINIKGFKGLAQQVASEDLSPEYSHTLSNIDCDQPVGYLSKRGGFSEKYSDDFTDIISAFEYEFPTSGDTVLILNDNGTLKTYTNGAALASLTLPTVKGALATLEANFRNQFFGYKDHVVITAGNAATTYVLGLHYVKRVNASGTGLFGNAVQSTSYKLVPNQVVFGEGQFSDVYNVAQVGTDYYFSFINSRYIEKRNSSLQLVERILANVTAAVSTTVAVAGDASYLYVGTEDGVYMIDPDGYYIARESTYTDIIGIAVDPDYVFVVKTNAIRSYVRSDFTTSVTEANGLNILDITCDPASDGPLFICTDSGVIERYLKSDFSDTNHTHTVTPSIGTLNNIIYDSDNDYVLACGETGGTASVKRYNAADLTLVDTNTITGASLRTFLPDTKVIEENYGVVYPFNSSTPSYPTLMNLSVYSTASAGTLDAGTYFYKYSLVDVDGQESILSDPVVAHVPASKLVNLYLSANDTVVDQLYRIQTINLYRAYNGDSVDELSPATNYKFLKAIDINSTAWQPETNLNIYYYDYEDDTSEANISSVTFLENAGFSENTKSRYLNYKVHTWIQDRLHCANFYVDGETYKSKIAKSQVNGPDVVPFADTYDYSPYDGDEIKNITTTYSRAYVMKQRSTGIFYNDVLERRLGQGLADTDSFLVDVDTIYMVSNTGIYEVNGANVKYIGDRVLTYFNARSSFTDCNVFLRDDYQRVFFSFPKDIVLVWNRKYDMWTTYTANMAHNGFFKNLDNEYIGYGKSGVSANQNFLELDDATTDNSASITVDWYSPKIRMDEVDGFHSELTQLFYRHMLTGTLTFYVYDQRDVIETNALSFTMETQANNLSVIAKHTTDVWGESFRFRIVGACTVFQLASFTLFYVPAGFAEERHA